MYEPQGVSGALQMKRNKFLWSYRWSHHSMCKSVETYRKRLPLQGIDKFLQIVKTLTFTTGWRLSSEQFHYLLHCWSFTFVELIKLLEYLEAVSVSLYILYRSSAMLHISRFLDELLMGELAKYGSALVFVGLSRTLACGEEFQYIIIIIIIMILGAKVIS